MLQKKSFRQMLCFFNRKELVNDSTKNYDLSQNDYIEFKTYK